MIRQRARRVTVASVTRDLLATRAAARRGRPHGCIALPGGSTRTPAAGRELIRTWLLAWEIPAEQAQDMLVIATELLTNAVVHTDSSQVVVEMQIAGRGELRRLRVIVSDQDPYSGPIRVDGRGDQDGRDISALSSSGRGLAMVSALADQWGTFRGHTGTHVWAMLLLPAAGSSSAHTQSAGTTSGGGL